MAKVQKEYFYYKQTMMHADRTIESLEKSNAKNAEQAESASTELIVVKEERDSLVFERDKLLERK